MLTSVPLRPSIEGPIRTTRQEVRAGERIGMIRFGSRVDLLLPEGVGPMVQIGDQVKGGESVMGVVS